MEIIHELEPDPRGIYTGAIGFIAPDGSTRFNVAIRTVAIDRSTGAAEYGAGGGIVWDSEGEDEYQECLLKARVLTAIRPDFDLLETLCWEPEAGFKLLDRHLDRLGASAEYFRFPCSPEEIRRKLKESIADGDGPRRLRLTLSRTGTVAVESTDLNANPDEGPVRVALASAPVDSSDPFLYHKTTHRQVYEQALESVSDCDDALLWNDRGEVTESTIANLVVELDGRLLTPPLESGLLPGTMRAEMLEQGEIAMGTIRIDDLKRASRILLVNSVRGTREARLESVDPSVSRSSKSHSPPTR
jgi:para-aminobenzoate synthetase/4-amino-4-deoxychorismate lyase